MKRIIHIVLTIAGITTAAFGQGEGVNPPKANENAQRVLQLRLNEARELIAANDRTDLSTFDLDFKGGTPQQLVEAIENAGTTLNVIIPNEHKNVQLPPLKMKNVNVKQLFEALEQANMKTIPYVTGETQSFGGDGRGGRRMISERVSTMGFRSAPPVTRESVWYFQVTKPEPLPEPRMVRYYQLRQYLGEYDIDDITTAIQAGWKMRPEEELPNLNFHEDTTLLIAVGSSSQLTVIDSVLQQLEIGLASAARGVQRPPSSGGTTAPRELEPPRNEKKSQ